MCFAHASSHIVTLGLQPSAVYLTLVGDTDPQSPSRCQPVSLPKPRFSKRMPAFLRILTYRDIGTTWEPPTRDLPGTYQGPTRDLPSYPHIQVPVDFKNIEPGLRESSSGRWRHEGYSKGRPLQSTSPQNFRHQLIVEQQNLCESCQASYPGNIPYPTHDLASYQDKFLDEPLRNLQINVGTALAPALTKTGQYLGTSANPERWPGGISGSRKISQEL